MRWAWRITAGLCHAFPGCCHSNTSRAPIANPSNSAQLGGIQYYFSELHPGPCYTVSMRPRTDRQTYTHTDTQTRVTTIHFSWSSTHAKCNEISVNKGNTQTLWRTFRGVLDDSARDDASPFSADDYAVYFKDKINSVRAYTAIERRRTMLRAGSRHRTPSSPL